MELDKGLLEKLKDTDITSEEIMQDFNKLYSNHKSEVATHLKRKFISHATLHKRNDVVKSLQPFQPGGNVDPLSLAVQHNNLELVRLFVDAGYSIYGSRGDTNGLDDRWVEEGPIQLAIGNDNVEAMNILMPTLPDEHDMYCTLLHF